MRMTRLLLSLAIVAVLTAPAYAQPQPAPQAGAQPGQGPTVVRRMQAPVPPPRAIGEAARVPMALVDGIPVVDVTVSGRPYRFALDTGAGGHGRIRPAVAEALGLAVTGIVRAGDGSGAVQERRNFAATALSVGDIRFEGVQLTEMGDIPGRLQSVDGIIGRGLFAELLLAIDYAGGTVALSRGAPPASAAASEASQRGIVVSLDIGGRAVPAVIDTGNAMAPLVLPTALADGLRSGEARQAGRARTAISEVEIMEADLAVPVSLGGERLPVSRFRYPAIGDLANIGSQAFAGGTLIVDQASNRVAFVPAVAR